MEKVSFFHADYRDDTVHVAGKQFPAGSFAVQLLNQYQDEKYADAFRQLDRSSNILLQRLNKGYLNPSTIKGSGRSIIEMLQALSALEPFALMGVSTEIQRIEELFTYENADLLAVYYYERTEEDLKINIDAKLRYFTVHKSHQAEFLRETEARSLEITQIIRFYSSLHENLQKAHTNLLDFVARTNEVSRYDELHLAPIAEEVFGSFRFPVSMEFIMNKNPESDITARVSQSLHFEDYYSFIVTDFFEGLHHGHYPRQCEVCGRYFLMTSARRQKYCNGNAPFKIKGKTVSCRDYGARIKEKERAEDDPVIAAYKSLTSNIRVDKHRKNISPRFADVAKSLAEEYKQRAMADPAYAKKQYYLDMKQDALYSVVRKTVPQKEEAG